MADSAATKPSPRGSPQSAHSSPKSSTPTSNSASPRPNHASTRSPHSHSSSSPPSSSPKSPTANNNGVDDALARAEALKAQGTARYTAGAFDEAIPLYSSALSLLPPSAPASTRASLLSNRAACSVMLKKFPAALQDSVEAIEADPTFAKAYTRAAKCHLSMGEFSQARLLLQKSPVKPTAAELAEVDKFEKMQQRASELVSSNPQLCLQFLSPLLQHCPANAKAQALQVQALINSGQVDKAKTTVDALYREDPKNVEFLYLRGLCFYHAGNLDMALKHMQQVLNSDPDMAAAGRLFKQIRAMEARKAEGNALFSTEGKAQEAVEKYTECLALDPASRAYAATILANRAAAYMKLGKWDEAIADCDQSLSYKADNVKVLLRRAACRKEKGELEEQCRDIEAALRIDTDNDDLKRQLREAKLELKKSKRKDYYAILGLDKNFSDADLKKAYRKAALQWHPDKNTQSEEAHKKAEAMFKDITEAYEVLSDEQKRRRYDSGVDLDDEGGMPGGMGGIDPSELFSAFFGGGGMGGFGGMGGMGGMGGGGMPFGRRPGGHGHAHGRGGFH